MLMAAAKIVKNYLILFALILIVVCAPIASSALSKMSAEMTLAKKYIIAITAILWFLVLASGAVLIFEPVRKAILANSIAAISVYAALGVAHTALGIALAVELKKSSAPQEATTTANIMIAIGVLFLAATAAKGVEMSQPKQLIL